MDAFNRGMGLFIIYAILMFVLNILTGTESTNLTWQMGLVFATWYAFKNVVK